MSEVLIPKNKIREYLARDKCLGCGKPRFWFTVEEVIPDDERFWCKYCYCESLLLSC